MIKWLLIQRKEIVMKLKKKLNLLLFLVIGMLSLVLVACSDTKKAENVDASTGKIEGVDDLAGRRIGVQLGTTGATYAADLEEDGSGTTVTRFNTGADAIQALKQNKIDCVIIDEQPALAFIEKNPELKILEEEFTTEEYAIGIAKGNTELRDSINEALSQLKTDGTLDKIISNYIGDGTKGKYQYEPDKTLSRKNGTLVMATNAAFPPYEYYEGGDIVGIDVDIANAIADKLDMSLEIKDIDFGAIIVAIQTGKADIGLAGMTVTEDRLKNIDFTDGYTTSTQVIVVNTGEDVKGQSFSEKFHQVFIEKGRWEYIPKGLLNTTIITVFAGIIGIVIGFIFAIIRVAHDRNDEKHTMIKILNGFVKLYLTIFRGTPVMVQLLIMYYVVFAKVQIAPIYVAILAFGLNSAAYVSEAVRAGIMSVEIGQFEAGRSLGFTYAQTMRHIVMPQAIKNSLPTMCNEFIALLKESSIVGYIGLVDLTKAGDIIRSDTYEAMLPLIAVALVYLVIVMLMTYGVGRLERRLKKDAR